RESVAKTRFDGFGFITIGHEARAHMWVAPAPFSSRFLVGVAVTHACPVLGPELRDGQPEPPRPSVDERGFAVELAGDAHHVALVPLHQRLQLFGRRRLAVLAASRR